MEEEKAYSVTSFQCTQNETGKLLSLNASMTFEREVFVTYKRFVIDRGLCG